MISFDALENAFLYVSYEMPFMHTAILNKKTGKIYYDSEDLLDFEKEIPDDFETNTEDYVSIPHKNDLGLGKELVFDFVSEYLPNEYERVEYFFSGRGAYRMFKDFLASINMLEKWYEYENEKTKLALIKWCEEEGLEVDFDS